jgi:hypothetical protein
MYGMFYHLQPKAEQQQAAWDHLFRWEQEFLPNVVGYVGGYLFQPNAVPEEILGFFVFESLPSYIRTRDDPEHLRWEQQLLLLLEHAPQYSEGEITELSSQIRGL